MFKFDKDAISEIFDFVEIKNKRDLMLLSKVDKKGYLKKLHDAEEEQDNKVAEYVESKYNQIKDAPISNKKKIDLALQAGINEQKLQKKLYNKSYKVKGKKKKRKNKNVK